MRAGVGRRGSYLNSRNSTLPERRKGVREERREGGRERRKGRREEGERPKTSTYWWRGFNFLIQSDG